MKLRSMMIILLVAACAVVLVAVGGSYLGRKLLFYPTHLPHNNELTPWMRNGEVIGYSRVVASPHAVWLMLHGNAGQSSDRLYAVPNFSDTDSVFILEYPGYGDRRGVPSKASFDNAAKEAYLFLREAYPHIRVCVASESVGSGPASTPAGLDIKPDKFVLIVPFDKLSSVAEKHFPAFLVRLLLRDNWDNVKAFSGYKGPVDIFAAESDTIVPVKHAESLASSIPGSRLVIINGGHNDWAFSGKVKIRYP